MPIYFSEINKTFYLESKGVSYVFRITANGYLNTLYFGKEVEREALDYLVIDYDRGFSANFAGAANRTISLDTMANEYPDYGRGDFRESAILIEQKDGNRLVDFKYDSHQILESKPPLAGMPSVNGGQTLVVTLKDSLTDLELRLYYTVFEDLPVLLKHAELTNRGKENVRILRGMSACFDFAESDFEALDLYGRHNHERTVQRLPLGHSKHEISSARGSSSHQHNPFMALLKKEAGETSGEVYGFQLVHSGSFSMSAYVNQFNATRVLLGINPFDFSWLLESGETFVTPEAVAVYSCKGLEGMSHTFHDLYREYLINPHFVKTPRPIVINGWESCCFDFNNEKLFSLIDAAAGTGIDLLVLDDGWFGVRNDDNSGLGDWFVNTEKLKGGLKPVIDHCHEKGLNFGLWIEPEMISENSDLYRAHPDWCIRYPARVPSTSRGQLVLDLVNPEAFEYIKTAISKLLDEYEISYIKWDMNRNITENYSKALPAERQQELHHRNILAVYKLAQFLTEKYPNVLFEGCSGGGGRFDPAMLHYFPQIWTSDNTDAYERAFIQYGTSLCYPLSSMTGHVSGCPNHQTQRITPFASRFDIASLCSVGYELDLAKMDQQEYSQIVSQTNRYRQIEPLLLEGDLYRICDPYNGNSFGFVVVSKDKNCAYLVYMQFLASGNPPLERIRLRGLDENKRYFVENFDLHLSGKTLMNAGITIPWQWGDFKTISVIIRSDQ